jgi:hypothetical protein
MSDRAPKSLLDQLYIERDAKFDEIVLCLSWELYSGAGPISGAVRERLIEEAEELTDNWAAAEYNHRSQDLSTTLQKLLNEHQEVCRQIIEILDAEGYDK